MPDDLGPLPKCDRQDTLQQRSILALRQALPEDLFLFRDERTDDKGVDGTLEVKTEGFFTNCRAQVQLKSTESDRGWNNDGSYSISITTSNLNYLLNGSCPIYVLWLAQKNELRFEWARSAWESLFATDPEWMDKETFTVRFSKVLTTETTREVQQRILLEARMQRRIHETLARSAPAENVIVSISRDGLRTTDPDDVHATLLKNGMTIVSSGYALRVLELFRLLDSNKANEPRIRLVVGYAASSIGRYAEAKAHLAEATLSSGEQTLSEIDKLFMAHLKVVADYNIGRISHSSFVEQLDQLTRQLPKTQSFEHQLMLKRHEFLSRQDTDERIATLEEMRSIANLIIADEESIEPQRIQAELVVLDAEADELTMQFIEDIAKMNISFLLGYTPIEIYRRIEQRCSEWMIKVNATLKRAQTAKHPILVAHAMAITLKSHVSLLVNAVAMSEDKPTHIVHELQWLADYAEQCIGIFKQAGNVHWECRAKMLLADFYEACGEDDKAKALALEVQPVARAFDFAMVLASAIEHIENRSMLKQLQARRRQRPSEDEIALSQTDSDIHQISMMTLQSMRLPIERLPLVEKEFRIGKYIAQQRRDWCRYLEIEQDLIHLQSSQTAYKSDPTRFGLCTKFEFRSQFGNADHEFIVEIFKRTFCEGCEERSPRQEGSAET